MEGQSIIGFTIGETGLENVVWMGSHIQAFLILAHKVTMG